jgi:hypothetical protein
MDNVSELGWLTECVKMLDTLIPEIFCTSCAHTVPMHLGLIDVPFVPHNLISDDESPVPLPKFQIAPRAKF